jgi:hypothetical protein
MQETTLNSKLLHQWILSQPVMPRARYLAPLIKDLSLTHSAPEQDFQIMQSSSSLEKEKIQVTVPAKKSSKTETETISSDLPIIKSTIPPVDEHIPLEQTDNLQFKEPIISFDDELRKTKQKPKSPAHLRKFLFLLIGGLVLVILGISIVYNRSVAE